VLRFINQTIKAKLWFEGDTLYMNVYWRSDPLIQELDRVRQITLNDNVMILNNVFHGTHQGTAFSVHISGRCAK
jgi:hypothetical protein